MSHDKIKAAARKRMADTGESYAAARREVIREFQAAGNDATAPAGGPKRFAISYDDMGAVSRWADTLMGGGPEGGRVEIDADELRLRMADFKVDVPRASIRAVARSSMQTKGTIGVHSKGGRWLANGASPPPSWSRGTPHLPAPGSGCPTRWARRGWASAPT